LVPEKNKTAVWEMGKEGGRFLPGRPGPCQQGPPPGRYGARKLRSQPDKGRSSILAKKGSAEQHKGTGLPTTKDGELRDLGGAARKKNKKIRSPQGWTRWTASTCNPTKNQKKKTRGKFSKVPTKKPCAALPQTSKRHQLNNAGKKIFRWDPTRE